MEGQSGVPISLNFQVKNVLTCKPLAGANVMVWHANNERHYSVVINQVLNADGTLQGDVLDFTDESFCRGMQTSDEQGRVQFVTALPGWYFPCATHIHFMVNPPGPGEESTTQLYLHNEHRDDA